jgi:hypothetical protein
MNRTLCIAIGGALGVQGVILVIALSVGVFSSAPEPAIKLQPAHGSPSQQRQQQQQMRQQMAQLERATMAAQSALTARMIDTLQPQPPRPTLHPASAMAQLSAALPVGQLFTDQTALTDALPAASMLPPAESVSFMGEQLNATRLVIAIDLSASVRSKLSRAGTDMQTVKLEALQLIDQLGPNHLFGLILFTRNRIQFADELLPATTGIRSRAKDWINKEFRTDGTSASHWIRGSPNGIQAVLSAAFATDPRLDEILILSDGDFYRTPAGGGGQRVHPQELRSHTASLQQQQTGSVRLRLILVHPPPQLLPQLRQWARENDSPAPRVLGHASATDHN